MKLIFKVLALFFLLGIKFPVFSQGCSTCRAQIINSSKEDFTVGNGLNTGILFLMIVPYIILFFLFRKQIFNFYKTLKSNY
jgi:hypothetical protein